MTYYVSSGTLNLTKPKPIHIAYCFPSMQTEIAYSCTDCKSLRMENNIYADNLRKFICILDIHHPHPYIHILPVALVKVQCMTLVYLSI